MQIDSNQIENEVQAAMAERDYGFNMQKLDAVQQVRNVTAVIVRTAAPTSPPPQT